MRALLVGLTLLASLAGALIVAPTAAEAQSATNYAAGNQWGTAPSGVAAPGALDSAAAHAQQSAVAGAVNAAENGLLLGTGLGGLSITSIGSQTLVSNTIVGNGNTTNLNSSQSSSNSASVSNTGTIQATLNH